MCRPSANTEIPAAREKNLWYPEYWSVHVFQRNQRFQAIEFVERPVREKHLIALIFPKLSSQKIRGLGHTTILIPSFHGLR